MMLRQLFSFSPSKSIWLFFLNSLELVSLLTYATYCFGAGAGGGYDGKPGFWLRAAERDIRMNRPGRTTRSADHTHPLTPTRPGPITRSHWSISQHGLHYNQKPRLQEPTRSAIISFLTTRYDRTALEDSTCVEMCSFGRQSRSDTPFPQGSSLFEPLMLFFPTPSFSRHVDRRLGALSSMKSSSLAQAQSLSYRHNPAATRNFRSSHSFNSLLLKAFDLFSTTSDLGVPRLVTLMALTERGKMDENI